MKLFRLAATEKASPGAIASMLLYLGSLVYTVCFGLRFGSVSGYTVTMLFTVGLGVIPLLVSLALRYDLRSVFRLSLPGPYAVIGGFFISIGLFIAVFFGSSLLVLFFPKLVETGAPLQEVMLTGNFPVALLAVAILPALCEEILFRGFILSGLKSATGKWTAIVLCGVLFGFLHLQPVQVPFTIIIGIGLSFVAYETGSLLVPILMHCAHNLLLLVIVRNAASGPTIESGASLNAIKDVFALGPAAIGAFFVTLFVIACVLLGVSAGFVYAGMRMVRKNVPNRGTEVAAGQ